MQVFQAGIIRKGGMERYIFEGKVGSKRRRGTLMQFIRPLTEREGWRALGMATAAH